MSKKGLFALLAGVALLVGIPLASSASKVQNMLDKIKFYPGLPSYVDFKSGFFNFLFRLQVMNQSAFDITIHNLFVSVRYLDPVTKEWKELVTQNTPVKITLNKYTLNKPKPIPLAISYDNIGVLKDLIDGKISGTLKVVTTFQYAGVQIPEIEKEIDAKAMLAPLRNILKTFKVLKGFGSTSIEIA
jgi:hypothetical protein